MNPSSSQGSTTPANTARHVHRRFFIGPLPEKVISHTETQARKKKRHLPFFGSFNSEVEDVEAENMINSDHAFRFFTQVQGGNADDWGETAERSTRREMVRRWKDSEWAALWSRRRNNKNNAAPASRWVGASFEVGTILGVNILQDERSDAVSQRASAKGSLYAFGRQSAEADTFVTAPTFLSLHDGLSTAPSAPTILPPQSDHDGISITPSAHRTEQSSEEPSSSTGLLESNRRTHSAPAIVLTRPTVLISSSSPNVPRPANAHVHYADSPEEISAPPQEVLERSGSNIHNTSAGATVESDWGDVVMKDRMLTRISYTKLESLGSSFDENANRTTGSLYYEDWAEFIVAWRKDRLEIYDDYTVPGHEWIKGHKRLAFVVPLNSPRTRVSLYSFVDLTFCITCPPTARHATSRSHWNRKDGTNIFVFKLKSRSRTYDWIWKLWRRLDGEIPPSIEIRNPLLDTRVEIDIPSDHNFQTFTRANVLALCANSLNSVQSWKNILDSEIAEGKTLELAWRMDTTLDWIWLEDDVDGRPRDWTVLCGLALKQPHRPCHLEIRLAGHSTSHIHVNGKSISEPFSIEGYVERIKPSTQAKQQLYLVTHEGNLFSLSSQHAHPPAPPGMPDINHDEDSDFTARDSEVGRGAMQVAHASGMSDLRSILLVRRASHLVPVSQHQEREPTLPDGDPNWAHVWAAQGNTPDDNDSDDEGGEEGLAKATDKNHLRMRRSFELLLTSGNVIRFEVHSRKVAAEWVERLSALVLFWRQKHRIDARKEIDLADSLRPRLTPLKHTHNEPEEEKRPVAPVDLSAPLPNLGADWCSIRGCKPITKGGKVFMRRGLRGQYKLVQLFIVNGHLVQFTIKPGTVLNKPRKHKINLIDSYVISGYAAALALPRGQYDTSDTSRIPRRYVDGLETDDTEEERLFMVVYRPQPPVLTQEGGVSSVAPATIPKLSAKSKVVVFRTRSKLERDAWVWALNCEIEKLARVHSDREQQLRAAKLL